ncbi:polysaccharide biosynthesis/export family protein [Mucilaginibacter sp. SMC90]|uniref:polysaccharide biosynthesis/export family protein n=1 Tax=Mucilaginibacter sp. SMC90 TaxID=2929803 RepID=UPI001FB40841|nr:polysaccharide biosynthesis/export family protein [Mucilaginibacter sp. SMC90]UOE48202.1 polysaccharide biosynthesis/export family protein [Mucilaginibacter sp. SMC90]
MYKSIFGLLIILWMFTFLSCSSTKKIKYFQNIPDSGQLKPITSAVYFEPKIQVDDILSVILQTVDPLAAQNVNVGNVQVLSTATGVGVTNTGFSPQPVSGYLVNKQGEIEIPILGKIKVEGLSTTEAKNAILQIALKYYKDPTIIVRYANFKISVTGEVNRPSVYIMPNEKSTVMDALSMAGDLTIYAKRDNILLIRQSDDGTKMPYRINLNKSDIFSSPVFYLRQNDIIYVEPAKSKIAANDLAQTRTIAILSSVLSLLIVLASRIN